MPSKGLPIWAVRRVNAVLSEETSSGRRPTSDLLARRTGLSKRLIRRCLTGTSYGLGIDWTSHAFAPAEEQTAQDRTGPRAVRLGAWLPS